MNTTHDIKVARDEPGPAGPVVWLASLIDHPDVHTFGTSIATALDNLRDATALWFEVEADSFDWGSIDVQLTPVEKHALEEARETRCDLARAEDAAKRATSTAVQALTNQGRTRRDIAALLGISHQRVQQIVDASAGIGHAERSEGRPRARASVITTPQPGRAVKGTKFSGAPVKRDRSIGPSPKRPKA